MKKKEIQKFNLSFCLLNFTFFIITLHFQVIIYLHIKFAFSICFYIFWLNCGLIIPNTIKNNHLFFFLNFISFN